MAKREIVQDFVINQAASGDGAAQIPAPAAGFCIRVLGYTLIAAGAVVAQWKSGVASGTTNKSGPMTLAASTGASPAVGNADSGGRQFQGGDGEAIWLNLAGPVQVGGHGTYQVLKTSTAGAV